MKGPDSMRVAIVSDIHGNRRAFEAVLADLRQVVPDLVLHGGDLAYGGAHPAETIDDIRSLAWPGVRGNTDEMLWAPQSLTEFAAKQPKLGALLEILEACIPPTLASIGEERLHFPDYGFQRPNHDPGWRRFQDHWRSGLQSVLLAHFGRYGNSPTLSHFRVNDMSHNNYI